MKTPSRLHFGIVDMRGDLGNIHVSVGVAIDRPNILLRAWPARETIAKGPRAERVKQFAQKMFSDLGMKEGAEFDLVSDIPEHAGFGSGTQLALAVGTALSKLYGLELSVEEMALMFGRSRVSGVGTQAFKHGGFIVDGGHRVDMPESVPPLVFRSHVPEDWLFVVGLPDIDLGRSGVVESEAFKRLEPPRADLVGEVSRVVLVKMIPAILNRDIESFGEAMTALDSKFGNYWFKVQGGRYSHPRIEEGVEFLIRKGVHGAGQSSWGPAFYGLVEGADEAKEVSEELDKFLNRNGKRGEAFYARPWNRGARIVVADD